MRKIHKYVEKKIYLFRNKAKIMKFQCAVISSLIMISKWGVTRRLYKG